MMKALRFVSPGWGRAPTFLVSIAFAVCATTLPASAQPKQKPPVKPDVPAQSDASAKPGAPSTARPKGPQKEQNFNFEGLGLNGRSRSPQLLIFLERANEELERASLEKRTFIPHMVRSVEEEAL